jgi:hypothetical protein
MRRLTQLWQALERIPGLCDIPAWWECHCGADYPLIRPHLRPTDDFGARYPCPHPRDGHCPRAIIDYEDGTFTAICRHPHKLCERIPLTAREALVYELDIASFLKPIAQTLGLRWQEPTLRFAGVWAIGISARTNTRSQPAFLHVQGRQSAFLEGVRRLAVEIDGPFLLIAPTEQFRDVPVQEIIQRRGIGFVALEDQIVVDDTGGFVGVDAVSAENQYPITPEADRERVLNVFCQKHDCPKTRVADEAEVHPADLYKWVRDDLPQRSKKSARIETVLRRGILKRKI